MTLTMERPTKARSLKKRRDPLEPIPLTPALEKLLAEQDADPAREMTNAECLEVLRWLKADLADAAKG